MNINILYLLFWESLWNPSKVVMIIQEHYALKYTHILIFGFIVEFLVISNILTLLNVYSLFLSILLTFLINFSHRRKIQSWNKMLGHRVLPNFNYNIWLYRLLLDVSLIFILPFFILATKLFSGSFLIFILFYFLWRKMYIEKQFYSFIQQNFQ